ncbi:hypothetical protein RB195_013882 [Necator americanus]|uniref:Uncharacterized protein n=1 Tax=Necator americanus TaxID=51031 RepID=A0ABR1DXL8_NECAM
MIYKQKRHRSSIRSDVQQENPLTNPETLTLMAFRQLNSVAAMAKGRDVLRNKIQLIMLSFSETNEDGGGRRPASSCSAIDDVDVTRFVNGYISFRVNTPRNTTTTTD